MRKMKKTIALIMAASLLISLFPLGVLAKEEEETQVVNTYGLKENPIVFSGEGQTVLYEAESYPGQGDNWQPVSDEEASGGVAIKRNKSILGGIANVPANDVQYRLYVKATERTKLRIWLRYKITTSGADIAYSQGENTTAFKGLSEGINGVLNEYAWTCFVVWDLRPDQITSLNIVFRSIGTYMDKIIITNDMFYMPRDMGETSDPFYLGKDTTQYDNLSCPLPPFKPVSERPRVFVNSKRLEEVRKNLTHEEHREEYQYVIKRANIAATDSELSKTTTATMLIESCAFLYLLNKDEAYGRKAIDSTLRWCELFGSGAALMADVRERGYACFILAKVYDWCYDLMDDETKLKMLEHIIYNASYLENGYPSIRSHGRNNGHESEGDIFVSLMSCGIITLFDKKYIVCNDWFYNNKSTQRDTRTPFIRWVLR